MKSFLFFAFVTLISIPIFSQDESNLVEFNLGEPFNMKNSSNRVLKKDDTGYYVLSMNLKTSILYSFGKDYKYKKKAFMDFNLNNYKGVIEFGNESVVFETKKLKGNKISLNYRKLLNDPLGFDLPVEIVQIDMEKKSSESDYFSVISPIPNSNNTLIYSDISLGKGDPATGGVFVLDSNMQIIWSLPLIMINSRVDEDMVKNIKMGKDGKVYVLLKSGHFKWPKSSKNLPIRDQKFKYEMLIFERDIPVPKKIKIDIEEGIITGINFNISPSGDMEFCGTYWDLYNESVGVFNLVSNSEGEFDYAVSEITKKFNVSYTYLGGDTAKVSYTNYIVNDLINLQNNTTTMIAEQYSMSGYGGVFGEILIVNFSALGKVNWVEVIPKLQVDRHFLNDYSQVASYGVIELPNDEILLFFNDIIFNKELTYKDDEIVNVWGTNFQPNLSYISLCKVSESGVLKRIEANSPYSKMYVTYPLKDLYKVNETRFISVGISILDPLKKRVQILELELKNK